MKFFLILLFSCVSTVALSQNKQLLYNFNDLPQNLMSNPGAEINFDMHAGLPLLSQMHFSAGSSGVNLYDIFKEDGNSINARIRNSLHKLSNKDFFTVNEQLELLSIGWRGRKRRYYSAGIYQESDVFLYFPKDPALLIYEGNNEYVGKKFHFSDIAFTAEVINVFHLGLTNYYSKDFNYGFRGKVYSGVMNAQSLNNSGYFRTGSSGNDSTINHVMSGVDVVINTSGLSALETPGSEVDSGVQQYRMMTRNAFLGGNLGLGLDAGFTWYPGEQYRVTGSILDLGFLWHKKDVESYRYYGDYETRGVEFIFPGSEESLPGSGNELGTLDENLFEETLQNSYISWRPVKINASLDYGFEEDYEPCNCRKPTGRRRYYNHIGFHLFAMKRPRGLVQAATLSFDRRLSEFFRGKISYTVDSFSFSNVGLLVSGRFNNLNLYLAVDNLLDYSNLAKANNASVQLGIQLIFTRK